MNNLIIRPILLIVALTLVSVANAQTNDWYVAPSIVYTDDDADREISDSVAGGQVNVGRNITDRLSLEGHLGYSDISGWSGPGRTSPDQTHLDISANLLAFYDRDSRFAPYALFGIGYLGVEYSTGGHESRPTGSLGVGFKWRMGQSNVSIRSEYRARYAYDRCSARCVSLTDYIATVGVQVNFGGKPEAVADPDSDGDGVSNYFDHCPNTPRDVEVDSNGCRTQPGDDRNDDDGDRIFNSNDQCPNTPIGTAVGPDGCSLDSDNDGVNTDRDRCPSTRPGVEVDEFGCDRDDDKDGVPDHRDNCPNSTEGVRIDVHGCEIKEIIRLPGMNFESGSDRLLAGAERSIEDAAQTLKMHPDLRIEVAGHTDNVGEDEANYGLSVRRAGTVLDHLVAFGIDAARLTSAGYGEAQPIADNATAEGRATNRRVELRIVTP
jgi:OOP family OmpA-OmpF porin